MTTLLQPTAKSHWYAMPEMVGSRKPVVKVEGMDWATFFVPGSPVVALPNWRQPRLYVSASSPLRRWRVAAFYPAVRPLARLHRTVLKARAAVGRMETRPARSDGWILEEFFDYLEPGVDAIAVRTDRNDPDRKATIQLWNERRIVGYIKYGEGGTARERLRREFDILTNLPHDLGPKPRKYGSLAKGEGFLTQPIVGKPIMASLPPNDGLNEFLGRFPHADALPIEVHPWTLAVRESSPAIIESWLEELTGRAWPVTIQHGDLTPWNLVRRPDGSLQAVDWEYAALEGLPTLDLAHYVLQVAALIYRWTPQRAVDYAIDRLVGDRYLSLSRGEAEALVRLAAYDGYRKSHESQESAPHAPFLQGWRHKVWAREP